MVTAQASLPTAKASWSFAPVGRLVHLRWAVAEIAIGIETPSASLDAAERALRVFCQRASALLEALRDEGKSLADAVYAAELGVAEAQSSLSRGCALRAERAARLHEGRRKLHRALVVAAEAMAREESDRVSSANGVDAPELCSLLKVRHMLSAFRGALISAGEERARLSWALEVVALELSILRANPARFDLPLAAQAVIEQLAVRVAAWCARSVDPVLGRALYREACALPSIAAKLSFHPLLLEHDDQSLSELSALLANEPSGPSLESKVLGHLSALRGLDTELDRLELSLIYGAAGALGTLSLRIADLRARLSRPPRVAASWS
jgi:hypothetical protein